MMPDFEKLAQAFIAMWRTAESAPKNRGSRVLLFDGIERIGTRIEDGYWEAEEGGLIQPTHWMPLPGAPITDASGRYLAPPQPTTPERPAGPHDRNHDAREPVR